MTVEQDLQLAVSVKEMAKRYRQSPEEVYGERTVAENPDATEAAKQFCWHRPHWPCSECWGHSLLAIVPLRVKLEKAGVVHNPTPENRG